MEIFNCPFCDDFNVTEVTHNRFLCRKCGEKWQEDPEIPMEEPYDPEDSLEFMREYKEGT